MEVQKLIMVRRADVYLKINDRIRLDSLLFYYLYIVSFSKKQEKLSWFVLAVSDIQAGLLFLTAA